MKKDSRSNTHNSTNNGSANGAASSTGSIGSAASSAETHDQSVQVTAPATAADKISDAVGTLAANISEGMPGNDADSDDKAAGSRPRDPRYILTIDDGVVEKISSLAAQKADGIIDMKGSVLSMIQEGLGAADDTKGVNADVDDGTVTVELSIILEYGKSALEVFEAIKESVTSQVRDMTGLEVSELTVNVVDVAERATWEEEHGARNDAPSGKDDRYRHVTLAQAS